MVKTTPFHPRTEALNQTMFWSHWVGYATAVKYQFSEKVEYFATRNAAALFDTSPLFKYRFKGPHAEKFLAGVLARDIRSCEVGQAHYTIWCDDRGFLVEDGVILRLKADEYWLTTAEPNLVYFQNLAGNYDLEISDFSADYGILAVQGPHSCHVLQQLTKAVNELKYFRLAETKIAKKPVVVSRTGYTGDLGYEIWVQADDALAIWDAVMEAGQGYNITPIGMTALSMARIEAGLLLMDVDFESSRYAWIDEQRSTPIELGFQWMFRNLKQDDRSFIGRAALERELAQGTSRWKMVGLEVDWLSYQKTYNEIGLIAPKDPAPIQEDMSLYDEQGYIGYATSFMFSPLLQKHIGLGRVPLKMAKVGAEVLLELMVNHRPKYVRTRVASLPFFNPPRKTA